MNAGAGQSGWRGRAEGIKMCLIVFAYRSHPHYRLVLAANRDEFYARPTAAAGFWPEDPNMLAGRDLRGNGTWCGVTRSGRFAAVTNFRDPTSVKQNARSRGLVVSDFLRGRAESREYLRNIIKTRGEYNEFNLLVGEVNALYYYASRTNECRSLAPGIYGLSNHLLDTPWPKVERAKRALQSALAPPAEIQPESLFNILSDRTIAEDALLPRTGVGPELEKALSPAFIISPGYGTRSSTVLMVSDQNHATFMERTFVPGTSKAGETLRYEFAIQV